MERTSARALAMSGAVESHSPTARPDLEAAVGAVRHRAEAFVRLPVSARIDLLQAVMHGVRAQACTWVERACHAKDLDPRAPEAGEEWLAGPVTTMRNLRLLIESLREIERYGRPRLGQGTRVRPDGRLEIVVFPTSRIEQVLFAGFRAHALMAPGVDEREARRRQAAFYQGHDPKPRVALILGAGNVSSIPPLDVLTKSFIEGQVCVLKMNPVNEWLGPVLEEAMAPMIEGGYLRIAYGGADAGAWLVAHPAVDDVHITGSDRTHDLIVWGPPGPDRERRKKKGAPLCKKRITSELGNVSPVAIVPGRYTEAQLWFQARNVASMVANNGSFNCNAAKVLVTARNWSQREAFLDLLRKALASIPLRKAYYPGAFERYDLLLSGRRKVERFGEPGEGQLSWALVAGLDPDDTAEKLYSMEPFCGILGETALAVGEPVPFLEAATEFLNGRLWGTLNAAIVISPHEERDPLVAEALDRAILRLEYGSVAINHWPALSYGFVSPPWGGHPGSTLTDIQSGLGWVHNTFMLDGIEKSVVRGPITTFPKPVWFCDHRTAHIAGERLLAAEFSPSWSRVPGIAWAALRG